MFKLHPEYPREFSNTYITTAENLFDAANVADIIEARELTIFDGATTITRARISTHEPGDSVYTVRTYNDAGTSGVTSPGEPLFNTCRIDVNVTGSGRPSRFHYRNIHENEHTGRALEGTFVSLMTAWFNGLLADVLAVDKHLVQGDGDELTDATCYPFVVQRSKSRRRRKIIVP